MSVNNRTLPELLCPAGTRAAFEAAVSAGADAVYLGAKTFNARANAANFTLEELRDICDFAHAKGVRIYLTLNTLIYDREMRDCLEAACRATEAGADALIVADAGLASVLRRAYPEIRLHASTQMSVHNAEAGRMLAAAGFERAVLARELSGADIRTFTQTAGIQSEVFIHGALCVCHSGQCLFSSLVGGRSGNRGECAQPCRLPYTTPAGKTYPLSLRDLSLCRHVPELIDLNITSLKIEGRMKPAEYVGAVTSVWRRLLDENRPATDEEEAYLSDIFSRSGFTDGYFVGRIDKKMLGVRSEEDKKRTAAARISVPAVRRDLPAIPKAANSFPAPAELPLQKPEGKRINCRSAVFYDPWQVTDAARRFFDICYIPLEKYAGAVRDGSATGAAVLPPVIFDSEEKEIVSMLRAARSKGLKDVLVSNPGHLHLALENGLVPHGNFRLNICGNETMLHYEKLGFADAILSPELTLPRIRDIRGNSLAVVYGRIPLMITEKCVGTEAGGCRVCDSGKAVITDRMGKKLPVLRVWNHRSEIYNCVPVYMADRPDALREAGIRGQHFIFSTETPRQIDQLIRAFSSGAEYPLGGPVRRIQPK